MTRLMYDSDRASAIPAGAAMVAGYVDLWSPADWARFSGIKVRIARAAYVNDGDVLDIESGDATPDQAPGWVLMRRAATDGTQKTVYMSESVWQSVRDAFRTRGVEEPEYWVAAYPGIGPVLYPGSVAHQYVNEPGSGGHYDLSVVTDYWPGVDPEPVEEILMLILNVANSGGQWLLNGSLCVQLQDPATVSNLTAAGVRQAEITQSELNAILTAGSGSGGTHVHAFSGDTAPA